MHVLYDGLGDKSGDNFWIKSKGLQSTLLHFSDGMTPQLNYLARLLPGAATEYVTVVLMIALLTGFLAVVSLVDHHSPISTPRNFIVLLPAVSQLVGLTASGLTRAGDKHVVVLVAQRGIAVKTFVPQNNESVAMV